MDSIAFNNDTVIGYQWSFDQDQLMIKLFNQGLGWAKIAESFPNKTISECYGHGFNDLKLARDVRIWTDEEDQRMIKLFNQRLPWKQIALFFPDKSFDRCYSHGFFDLKLKKLKPDSSSVSSYSSSPNPDFKFKPSPGFKLKPDSSSGFSYSSSPNPDFKYKPDSSSGSSYSSSPNPDFKFKPSPGFKLKPDSSSGSSYSSSPNPDIVYISYNPALDFDCNPDSKLPWNPYWNSVDEKAVKLFQKRKNTNISPEQLRKKQKNDHSTQITSESVIKNDAIRKLDHFVEEYIKASQTFQTRSMPSLAVFQAQAKNDMKATQNTQLNMKKSNLSLKELLKEIDILEKECQQKINIYDALYQHVYFYQQDKATQALYKKIEASFVDLYNKLYSKNIALEQFESDVKTVEFTFRFNQFKNLFLREYHELCRYNADFSPQYKELIGQLYKVAEICLISPKPKPGQDWKEAILTARESLKPLEGMILRMTEVANFLNETDCDRSIESIIMARLRNEMTSSDFKMASQEAEARYKLPILRKEFLEKLERNATEELTLEDLEKIYKRAVLKLHPDKGGKAEDIAVINNKREEIKKLAAKLPAGSKF